MLDLNMFRDIAVMVRFVFAQVTVIPLPLVVVSTLNMRVQYGCLNSFIVAMVTFEELFWIMSSHVHFQISIMDCREDAMVTFVQARTIT